MLLMPLAMWKVLEIILLKSVKEGNLEKVLISVVVKKKSNDFYQKRVEMKGLQRGQWSGNKYLNGIKIPQWSVCTSTLLLMLRVALVLRLRGQTPVSLPGTILTSTLTGRRGDMVTALLAGSAPVGARDNSATHGV